MNKTMKKTLVAGLLLLLHERFLSFPATVAASWRCECRTANGQAHEAPEHKDNHQTPAPANHRAPEHHAAPVAHHEPPPAHHEPPPPAPNGENTGWAVLGAVVGGIVGACL